MADPRFFTVAGPFTVAEIAQRVGAQLGGAAEGERVLRDVAPLDTATEHELSFLDNRHYLDHFRHTRAGAVIVNAKLATEAPKGATLLITPQPYRAYAIAAQAFYPEAPPKPGIAATAIIDPSATLGEGCAVEHNAVIGSGVVIGKRCAIGANTVIGNSVVLGDDVRIAANATLSHCIIGVARAHLYRGAHRPGWIRFRARSRCAGEGAATRPRDGRRRCRDRRQHDDRSRRGTGHGYRPGHDD